jgi:hypothetical protein
MRWIYRAVTVTSTTQPYRSKISCFLVDWLNQLLYGYVLKYDEKDFQIS